MPATRPAKLPSADTRTRRRSTRSTKKPLLKVLLADDHQLILDAVRHALEGSGEFKVVAEAKSVSEVLPLVTRARPDIVLLDIRIAGMDGLVCLDQIKQSRPETTVIVLTVLSDQTLIDDALKRGASAYIVKSVKPVDLPSLIRQAIDESLPTAAGLADDTEATGAKTVGLTRRETAVLTALAEGASNRAIANQLGVGPQTVKYHLSNIYRKLHVADRTNAARHAYQHGLVKSPFYEGDSETSR